MLPFILLALLLVNTCTVLLFWLDKERSIRGDRRIPEADLLGLALIGGTPGAFLARHLLRHKTRKEFCTRLKIIFGVQLGILLGVLVI